MRPALSKKPPPIPAAARVKETSGVRRRPAPPPKAKLPPKRAAAAPMPVEDDDTLIEDDGDAFDALLRGPELPAAGVPARARLYDLTYRGLDLVEGSVALLGAQRDARILGGLMVALGARGMVPIVLLFAAIAAWQPAPELVKERPPKPTSSVVLVPLVIPIIVREAAPADDRDRPRRTRRARHRSPRSISP
jgi:hypothetical protein